VLLKNFDQKFSEQNYKDHANFAYQVQKQTQNAIAELIKKFVTKTKIKNVCITGGYGLNVVSNAFYQKVFPDINFYFEPLSDDSGNSIGVSLLKHRSLTGDSSINKLRTTFFHGFEYQVGDGKEVSIQDVVDHLIDQKSVATFYKKSEGGPRSLGHRSILFDARNKNAKDIINRIKKREWYRPFAAVCLIEDARMFFEMETIKESPFMTISFKSKDNAKETIPGFLHVDGTCRIQTIDETNVLYPLLKKFKEKTGVGVLLNTSFNLAGEPLVETPEDARMTFTNSDLNFVWFPENNRLWIKK
jgi:carbamoyltransferase